MNSIFDLLGVCLACYTAYAAWSGSVFVRHRAWGKSYRRDDTPVPFWGSIATYAALSVALIVYF